MRILLLLFLLPLTFHAQTGTFRFRYDLTMYDDGAVEVLPDSSYALMVHTIFGQFDRSAIVKLSQSGQVQWTKTYAAVLLPQAVPVNGIRLSGGGYLLSEALNDTMGNSNRFIKTDANGNVVYSRREKFAANNSETPSDLVQTSDGYIVSIGTTFSPPNISPAFQITKMDTSGNLIWDVAVETDTTAPKEHAFDVIECMDGNYVACGRTQNPLNGTFDCYAVKISPAGTLVWQKFFGTTDHEDALAVTELSDGSLMFAGMGYDSFGQTTSFFFKTDAGGNLLWSKEYSSAPGKTIVQLRRKSGDRVLASGYGGASTVSPFILELDSAGNVQWCRYYYLPGYAFNKDLELTPDNGIVISGTLLDTVTFNNDVYLIKTDSVGKSDCLGTPVTCAASLHSLVETPLGYPVSGGVWSAQNMNATVLSTTSAEICNEKTGWEEIFSQESISVFPNPASDQLTITAGKDLRGVTLQLFDALGREALRKNSGGFAKGQTIDLPLALPPGIYQLVLRHEDGMEMRKVIIR